MSFKLKAITALEELKDYSAGIIAATIEDCQQVIRDIPDDGSDLSYARRICTYTNALIRYGECIQLTVALEELSECQKEICKFIRGYGNAGNLAEEVADARIMLEQVEYIFGIADMVAKKMDEKIMRLDARLRGTELPKEE